MPSGAIFISYAREDLAMAVKIAQTLGEAGLEVWLDQEELRGGDAWDAKIKRQIRECSLFLPIISQRTQARREGYFRLEWLLAEQRSRLIATGTPFLVPVAIDDVAESHALVPESFIAVQWTRAPRGECPSGFAARTATLLAEGSDFSPSPSPTTAAAPSRPRRRRPTLRIAAAVAAIATGLLLWKPWIRLVPPPMPPPGAAFPRDPNLQKAMAIIASIEAIPEDFSLAEELTNQVLAQRPTDLEATVVMASIDAAFLYRGFDTSAARLSAAQRYAERSVLLAPDNADAQAALGIYLFENLQPERGRQALEKAISLKPDEPLFHRFRDNCLFVDPKVSSADAIAAAEKTVALFPNDALLHYELSRHYRDLGRIGDMERELDRTIAIQPIVNALVWKARVALWVRGDPEEMKRILDRVPPRGHSLERWAIGTWIYSVVTGKSDAALQALEMLPEDWVDDFDFVGPKLLLLGLLHDQAGKHDLAKVAYAGALAIVNSHKTKDPGNSASLQAEVWCLHGLDRDEEARALLRALNQAQQRPYTFGFGRSWWFTSIPANLILGQHAMAVQFLREAVDRRMGESGRIIAQGKSTEVTRGGYPTDYRHIMAEFMRVDPRMAPWREDPEIKTLLDDPPFNGTR